MPPTRSRAAGLAAALSLPLIVVGAGVPVLAASSPDAAVNELLDAVEAGDYAAIEVLVCEAERDAVLASLSPDESMGFEGASEVITFRIDDRAVEVTSDDGQTATVQVSGTMSMDTGDADLEELGRAMLEADAGEVTDEDLALMLPFLEMALNQSLPMDEEVTAVLEDGEWVVCGGLGETPEEPDYGFDDDFAVVEVPAEGVCALATPEELTAVGVLDYDGSTGWELTSCTYQNWETYHNTTVTVELDSDAEYAARAYGSDQELEVAGGPAFTSDYANAPLIVQVGQDMLRVEVWPPDPAPDGFDGLQQAIAIAELLAPRVAESRESLIEPVKPLLCDLGFAVDFESALGLEMHSGTVDSAFCNYEVRDDLRVRASVSDGTIDDLLQWYPDSEETTVAGLPAFLTPDSFNEAATNVNVGLPSEQVLSITVEPAAYDKPISVSGLEVAELLTQHIIDRSTE